MAPSLQTLCPAYFEDITRLLLAVADDKARHYLCTLFNPIHAGLFISLSEHPSRTTNDRHLSAGRALYQLFHSSSMDFSHQTCKLRNNLLYMPTVLWHSTTDPLLALLEVLSLISNPTYRPTTRRLSGDQPDGQPLRWPLLCDAHDHARYIIQEKTTVERTPPSAHSRHHNALLWSFNSVALLSPDPRTPILISSHCRPRALPERSSNSLRHQTNRAPTDFRRPPCSLPKRSLRRIPPLFVSSGLWIRRSEILPDLLLAEASSCL